MRPVSFTSQRQEALLAIVLLKVNAVRNIRPKLSYYGCQKCFAKAATERGSRLSAEFTQPRRERPLHTGYVPSTRLNADHRFQSFNVNRYRCISLSIKTKSKTDIWIQLNCESRQKTSVITNVSLRAVSLHQNTWC